MNVHRIIGSPALWSALSFGLAAGGDDEEGSSGGSEAAKIVPMTAEQTTGATEEIKQAGTAAGA